MSVFLTLGTDIQLAYYVLLKALSGLKIRNVQIKTVSGERHNMLSFSSLLINEEWEVKQGSLQDWGYFSPFFN